MSVSFELYRDISGQLPPVSREGAVTRESAVLCGAELMLQIWEASGSREIHREADQTAFFCPSRCRGTSAAGKDVNTTNYHQHEAVFYTVHP